MVPANNPDPNDDLSDLIGGPKREPNMSAPVGYTPILERIFTEPCRKCAGSGVWRGSWRTGACFECKGTGKLTFKTSPEQRAKNRAGSAARKVRKAEQSLEAFKAEFADVWAWMDGNDFPFAVALRADLTKWGSLTPGKIEAARRAIAKRDAAKAAAAERVTAAKTVDISAIEAAFTKAGAKLKRATLRVAGLTISPAKAMSQNAGALYVKGDGGAYLGKIQGGRFIRSRECTAEQEQAVLDTAADPQGAAIRYGRLTGSCAICGRTLENGESVARGIGPICAERFGW